MPVPPVTAVRDPASCTTAPELTVKPRPAAYTEEREEAAPPPVAAKKMSVYEKLGWDDDYDDL